MKPKAFTLTELLTVVAIISVLAATAVPNFQDSLTRAKVARMQHDTKILGMAIENYRLDHGWYPYAENCDPTTYLCSVSGTVEAFQKDYLPQLMTPVAYSNSIPTDVFRKPYNSKLNKYVDYSITYAHVFQQTRDRGLCMGNSDAPPSTEKTAWTWSVYSFGPDKKASQYYDLAYWMQIPYDPSNGIMSSGDIQWSTQPPPVWDGAPPGI
ncbi:MAG: type II secretion system protein [bacterium]